MKGCQETKRVRYLVVKKNNKLYRVFYSDLKKIQKVEKKRLPKVPGFYESEPMPEETSFEPFSLCSEDS